MAQIPLALAVLAVPAGLLAVVAVVAALRLAVTAEPGVLAGTP